MVYHVGRRSGKPYETTIIAIPAVDSFVVALTYGPDVDWFRNVTAAGRCGILWHRHEYSIEKIEPMAAKTALPYFPVFERTILRWVGIQHFVRMGYQMAKPASVRNGGKPKPEGQDFLKKTVIRQVSYEETTGIRFRWRRGTWGLAGRRIAGAP
jgi:deazaflavin-dependent oxidoreductase (nitroreductase family)